MEALQYRENYSIASNLGTSLTFRYFTKREVGKIDGKRAR